MFWHNLLKRFIFTSWVLRNTKIPPGCREEKTKRFNKYPVVVCACVHTRARMVATPTQAHGLLKRFTAKMPLCKYLIINEIKYFF